MIIINFIVSKKVLGYASNVHVSKHVQKYQYSVSFFIQRKFKLSTEVFNWIQKYDADMGMRQVNDGRFC